jgi:hypothetical protein
MFVYRRYCESDYAMAMELSSSGMSDYSVAAELGIPRSTVCNWRKRKPAFRSRLQSTADWRPDAPASFSYLLGVYLGDGHLFATGPASWRLCVTLDAKHTDVIEEVAGSIVMVDPQTRVCRNYRNGATLLLANSMAWPVAFPQHGPGRKHERRIELVDWQREITHEHPKPLLRGLIHSDGSRCINRFKTKLPSGRVAEYAYPRYFFTNMSADIRGIFCEHCELLGVRWTQSNYKNISVSHRDSVAILDSFIGPKS